MKASSKVLLNYFMDTPVKKNIQLFKSQVLNIRPYQPQAFNINHKGCQSTSETFQTKSVVRTQFDNRSQLEVFLASHGNI